MARKQPSRSPRKGKRPRPAGLTTPVAQPGVDAGEAPPAAAAGRVPVVGVGASAGGLEAFLELLERLPPSLPMAIVLVQHLDPTHQSTLSELLSRRSRLPVAEATEGARLKPGRVYVIPPNVVMTLEDGVLHLAPRTSDRAAWMPIDTFLRSLADDLHERAIAVVLSGNASDGTLGCRAIKAAGGLTFVQDPATARFDGMPRNAVASGFVDFVLPPAAIAGELARVAGHAYFAGPAAAPEAGDGEQQALAALFRGLQRETGVDFTQYRQTTIRRRIARRMLVHRMDSLEAYRRHVDQHPEELAALYNDLLINVTAFFRDPGTFEVLQGEVFPGLLARRGGEGPIRIWVPGCATGEEVYSLAIALLETVPATASRTPIQIFGTDVSDGTIARARTGVYPATIAIDVSAERLRRFFVKADGQYQVRKTVRALCVFARHNLVKDPPFSRMDVISCRNVLIYLEPGLQKRAVTTFHYALNTTGVLLLGPSESVGPLGDLFAVVDKKHKLYAKKPTGTRFEPRFPPMPDEVARGPAAGAARPGDEALPGKPDLQREVDRIVLGRYAPAGVVVNEAMGILQFRGHVSRFLEPAPGQASLNVLKMAREGLLLELRVALEQARKRDAPVRRPGLRVRVNDTLAPVNLEVIPLHGPGGDRNFLVLFEEPPRPSAPARARKGAAPSARAPAERAVQRLRQELTATKEFLQSIIEEREAANEELRSANEELQSSNEELQSTNEELQSTNEELETAKEELHSVNEELTTVNEELQHRNVELNQLNNDLNNLFSSLSLPIVMLGSDLRVRRFTAAATRAFDLAPGDVGRPAGDLRAPMPGPGLERLCAEAMESGASVEREVRGSDGRWHALRVRPSRTVDGHVEGCMLALMDIDALRSSVERATAARDFAEAIIDTLPVPLLVLDRDLRVRAASRAFLETFRVGPEETLNRFLRELGDRQWHLPALERALAQVLERNEEFHGFEVEHDFPRVGLLTVLVSARQIRWMHGEDPMVLLALEDVTARKQAERELRASEEVRYRRLFETAKDGIVLVDADSGQITNVNPYWTALVGGEMEDMLGRRLWEIPPFQDLTVAPTIVRELQDKDFIRYDGVPLAARDGRRVVAELACNAYRLGGRKVIQCIVRDVTERVEFIEREQAARAEAEAANRAKDEFLSVLSHELRTPLTAMLGWVRMLKSGKLEPPKVLQGLDTIERNTRLQAQLIEDLLDVSRITTGKLRVEVLPVDFVAVVEAALETVRATAEAKHLQLEAGLDHETGPVPGDRYRLQQVVWNLLSNAVKFTPEGGRIEVGLERVGPRARLTIADTGRGIPPDFLPHIFDRFRQGDSATTRTQGGLGLGLAIVRDLVELHGGTVRAASPGEGQGATFTVELPLTGDGAGAITEMEYERIQSGVRRDLFVDTRARLDGLRVVVVEDERDTRELIVTVLQQYGVEVTAVESAAAALSTVEREPPDVLISDIGLPAEDGYALIARLRALPAERGGGTPAVALTAFAGSDDSRRALAAGFQMHVAKPVDPADLATVVAALAGRV